MNKEKQFKSVPLRSKPGLAIRITKREATFDQEAKIPVKQTQTSTFRTNSTSRIGKDSESVSSQTTQRSRTVRPQSEATILNNPNLINLRKTLLKSHDYTNVSTQRLNQLMAHLRLYSADSILKRDYDEAESADELAFEVKEVIQERENQVPRGLPENGEADVHNHLDKYIAELDQFDEQTVHKREELEKKQEEELQSFENKWKVEYPKKYRKPSAKLLLMIENERKVGFQGNYKMAREMKAKTDEQRRIEAEAAQERLNNDYIAARERFLEKQLKEREQFDQTRAENRQLLVSKQEQEFKNTINRTRVLSIKEHQQGRMRRSALYQENKASAAQLLKQQNNELLLPPLTPPDYKTIKKKEAEKNKELNKKHKETEERLFAKDERKRQLTEKIAQEIAREKAAEDTKKSKNRSSLNSTQTSPKSVASERQPCIVNSSPETNKTSQQNDNEEIQSIRAIIKEKTNEIVLGNTKEEEEEDKAIEEPKIIPKTDNKDEPKSEEKKEEQPKEEKKNVVQEAKDKDDEYSYYSEEDEEEEYSYYSDETNPM